MGITNKIIKIILGIILLVCILDMPYGYYQLVRFLGMIGFGALAFSAYQKKDNSFFIIWASSAVLINPLIKIALGRELWNIVDVIWALAAMLRRQRHSNGQILIITND